MSLIENAVPLAELAKACRTTVPRLEAEAAELSVYVGESWSGELAVSTADAHALRTGAARRQQREDARWAAHRAEAEAWTAERERVVEQAGQDAYRAATHRGEPNPKAAEVAQAVAVQFGRKYEAEHPVPLLEGQPGAASRRFADPETGLVRRVADRLLGVSA